MHDNKRFSINLQTRRIVVEMLAKEDMGQMETRMEVISICINFHAHFQSLSKLPKAHNNDSYLRKL